MRRALPQAQECDNEVLPRTVSHKRQLLALGFLGPPVDRGDHVSHTKPKPSFDNGKLQMCSRTRNLLIITLIVGSAIHNPQSAISEEPGLPPALPHVAAHDRSEPAKATWAGDVLRLSNELVTVELARDGVVRQFAARGTRVSCRESFSPFVVTEEARQGHPPAETWFHGPERPLAAGSLAGRVEARETAGAQLATYGARTDTGLLIRYWVAVRPGDPVTYWRMSVRNHSSSSTGGALVDRIAFPVLRGIGLGDPTDDWWTWPKILGATVRADAFAPGQFWRAFYPDWLTMQWVDLYDRRPVSRGAGERGSSGLYVGCFDDYGFLKEIMIGRGKDGDREIRFEFPGTFIVPGDEWTTPWFGLAPHQGDWRTGAAFYRGWAERTFGPIDVPKVVWDLPTSNCWLQHHAKQTEIPRLFEAQQQDPIHASYFMKSLPISYPEGWSGEYGDALDYRETCDRIRSLGGIAALFTFDRVPNHGKPHHADRAPRWLSVGRDGDFGAGFQDAFVCPWPKDYRETRILDALRWARECGIGAIHFDTDLLAGSITGPCYNPRHAHRPNETPHYFRLLYTEMVQRARKIVPGFFLRAEHCADFWYPAFAASTAHEFEVANGLVADFPNGKDAQLMPSLFRVTLPRHSALQTPSMSGDDFWVYGYGMGFGFHGGGPHQTFNPEVRSAEMPALAERFAETDWLWRAYYNWRVGFEDAVVFGRPYGEVAVAEWDGETHSCAYPGPLMACTFSGSGREVTLGYWYGQSKSEYFAKRFLHDPPPMPQSVTFRIPTRLPRIGAVYLHRPTGITKIECRRSEDAIQVVVPNPDRFAVEIVGGVHANLQLPPLANPGETVTVMLVMQNYSERAVKATPAFALPPGWRVAGNHRDQGSSLIAPGRRAVLPYRLTIPRGIFGRNYPVKVTLSLSDGTTTYAAAPLKVQEPITVFYEVDTAAHEGYRYLRCLEPGQEGTLRVTVVNNALRQTEASIELTTPKEIGLQGEARVSRSLSPGPASDFDPNGEVFRRWARGEGAAPGNVFVHAFSLHPTGVPPISGAATPMQLTVQRNGRALQTLSISPRFRLVDLNGPWRVKFVRNTRATTGGFWGRYDVEADDLVPNTYDGNWSVRNAPITLADNERRGVAWAIYRRRVDIPAEWQGTSIGLYVRHLGAPWGPGGTYNLVYVNGWPAGRLGTFGEVDLTPYLIYGGTNLIALQQFSPNSLVDPYLFTRGAFNPQAVNPVSVEGEEAGYVYINLRSRSSGNGIALPFIAGVTGDNCRRTDQQAGGENCFIYFAVADEFVYDTTEAVEVVVEYLDSGTDTFALHYDSRAPGEHPVGGPFKAAERVRKTGTGEWRRHVFRLKDARFANRQHLGADFRLSCEGDGDDSFRRVEVRRSGQ
ncbi:MAG: hypothetical protein HY318_17530 [Armatimonadetes bacterium]|nr:hypothetical protein [Armatimonadota bacterium]